MPKREQRQAQKEQRPNKFWNFVPGTEEDPAQLILYGTIASAESWWEDRVTPKKFSQELDALGDVEEIVVRINSGGGDVLAANAIYTRLRDHKATITVKIDGWAASAATIIAMAGDKIQIAKNGIFMIHDPSMTIWNTYTAEQFEKMAEQLKTVKQSIVNAYTQRTGRDEEEVSALMSEETWWTGEEAVEEGFCDELLFEEAETIVENGSMLIVNSVPIDITGFKTIPRNVFENKSTTKNRGKKKVQNKAEDKKGVQMSEIKTVQDLEKQYPGLVTEIRNEAVEAERTRIKDIKNLEIAGFEDIVENAMFEKPITAAETAMKIINKQKQVGANYMAAREEDVKESGVKNVKHGSGEEETKNKFDAIIDEMKF